MAGGITGLLDGQHPTVRGANGVLHTVSLASLGQRRVPAAITARVTLDEVVSARKAISDDLRRLVQRVVQLAAWWLRPAW